MNSFPMRVDLDDIPDMSMRELELYKETLDTIPQLETLMVELVYTVNLSSWFNPDNGFAVLGWCRDELKNGKHKVLVSRVVKGGE